MPPLTRFTHQLVVEHDRSTSASGVVFWGGGGGQQGEAGPGTAGPGPEVGREWRHTDSHRVRPVTVTPGRGPRGWRGCTEAEMKVQLVVR